MTDGGGNGTQKAQRKHKRHKEILIEHFPCASCVLLCAFCVPFPPPSVIASAFIYYGFAILDAIVSRV